ncbi:hypothetical protein BUALT_Bualt08G0124200 [Buddleja alternifolia]|uniref:C2 domain-containing protein n=1 Tax=Buddleja alternifolia TaxID=168488 RepID=A0AAV6X592_9LAMI|nr:hypothetical protein BUALT_Bualt08G0124200 [Buddleja alternifolia]
MKVHARVSIGGRPENEKRTPTDKHGETNPAWNFSMKFTISESMVQNYNAMLVIKLYCSRKLGDRYIGEIHTSMKELFDCSYASAGISGIMNFPVQKGCVNSQGVLKFSYRKFEITIVSAYKLEDVRLIGQMKVHARVSIGGRPENEKGTPTDKHGKTNPAWNFSMKFTVSESIVQNYNAMLVIKLYCTRKLGDRYIGEIHTSMKELFDCSYSSGGISGIVSFPVQKGCVDSQGVLNFSYRFGEKVMIDKLLLAETIAGWSLSS